MSNLVTCPQCENRVVWGFHFPKMKNDYLCHECGYTWKKCLENCQSQYGCFLGNWEGQEMTKLEENISTLNPDLDWSFFKGKQIYTAWQAYSPHEVIVTKTLDELIYWIALCTQDAEGTWYDTYNRLVNYIYAPVDTTNP